MEEKSQSQTKTNFKALIIIALLALIVGGVIYWESKTVSFLAPVGRKISKSQGPLKKEDSTNVIFEELEKIKIKNLDKEFQEIDQDLNSL